MRSDHGVVADGLSEVSHRGPMGERFVREATALLDEVFAGVEYQRMRLRHDQRLEEWSGG